jgi:uncharacterized protein (TIGR02466 family)
MQPLPVWPTMFYDFDWPDHGKHVAGIKRVCYKLEQEKNTSGVAPDAKRGLYESGFNLLNYDDPDIRALAEWMKQCLFKAAAHANEKYWPRGMNVMVNIHESWCHITRDGGFHDMHVHPGSSWSAIYYVDCGDMDAATKNGSNRFYSPNNSMWTDAGTAYLSSNNSIDFNSEPGMMIVFPSHIQHSALLYRGARDRIVIAINSKIERVQS